MIKLHDNNLHKYFSNTDTGHRDKSSVKNKTTFNFVSNQSNTLTVTVGDSWTFGADMTLNDDYEYRLTNHYGKLISAELSSDWLNLGQGGSGNFWLGNKVDELATIIPQLEYDHIYIICTFTEPGRAFNSELDRHIDYISWFNNNSNFNDLLKFLNNYVVEQILDTLKEYKNVTLKIGSNFVDHIGLEKANNVLLPRTWVETIYNQTFTPCYIVGTPVLESFKSSIDLCNNKNKNKYLDWIIELGNSSVARRKILDDPTNFSSYHPLAIGHRAWGIYILENL